MRRSSGLGPLVPLVLGLLLVLPRQCSAGEPDCWGTLSANGWDPAFTEAIVALADAGQTPWSMNSCALEFFNTPSEWEQEWFTSERFPGATAEVLLARLSTSATREDGLALCHGLSVLGDQAVPALVGALHGRQHRQRALAAALLARHGGDEAIRALAEMMRADALRGDVGISYFALLTVGSEAAGAVELLARSGAGRPRAFALVLLGFVGDERSAPTLRAAAADASADVRQAAVQSLVRVLGPEASAEIARAFEDGELTIRRGVVHALSRREPNPELALLLLKPLRDEYQVVREDAAAALGHVGDASVVPALRRMISEGDRYARSGAVFALEKIDDRSAIPEVLSTLGDPLTCTRRTAAAVLGVIGDAALVPSLVAMLEHGTPNAREGALRTLRYFRDRSATPALLRALHDADHDIRSRALDVLAATGDERSIPGLIEVVADDPSPPLAADADRVLRRLTGESFGSIAWNPSARERAEASSGWRRWWQERGEGFVIRRSEVTMDEDLLLSIEHPRIEPVNAPVTLFAGPHDVSERGPVSGVGKGIFSVHARMASQGTTREMNLAPSTGGFFADLPQEFTPIARGRLIEIDDALWSLKLTVVDFAEAETEITIPIRADGGKRGLVFEWVKFHVHATKKLYP